MKTTKLYKYLIGLVLLTGILTSCVEDSEYDTPTINCKELTESIVATNTIGEVKAMYTTSMVKFEDDIIIEGYVVSSDESGNIYKSLSIQDKPENPTATGKANFSINKPSEIELKNNQFIMMTIRTHDQFNTTIYGLNDRYRGVLNERRVIFMNADDMKNLGLQKLDLIDLTSHFNNERREAKGFLAIPYNIPKQCTATYFPEANVLVPLKSKADISNTPASKTVIITIKKR